MVKTKIQNVVYRREDTGLQENLAVIQKDVSDKCQTQSNVTNVQVL